MKLYKRYLRRGKYAQRKHVASTEGSPFSPRHPPLILEMQHRVPFRTWRFVALDNACINLCSFPLTRKQQAFYYHIGILPAAYAKMNICTTQEDESTDMLLWRCYGCRLVVI